ncbi:sodium/potassium/calcium exchanger 1-like [Salvelinus fontinalis]|uniref:sodium/potassium/calcium exchanger 1-like n=1 Tax=Salvelinus fontinalis TaxID=8038 RepID=UPI002485C541|nr:sodium/potassium/calcium exchanger 1-like [Salvelinus fontinalis]
MYCTQRKRLKLSRVIFLLSGVLLCCLYQLSITSKLSPGPWPHALPQIGEGSGDGEGLTGALLEEVALETLREGGRSIDTQEEEIIDLMTTEVYDYYSETTTDDVTPSTTTEVSSSSSSSSSSVTTIRTIVHCIYVDPEPPIQIPTLPNPPPTHLVPNTTQSSPADPGDAPHQKGDYPTDIFSVEDRRRGWVSLHIFGMMYMFVSLAIVCDEFFVPALGVITDQLAISDDVAGATFMAAGGSAPELFTSLIGVFISHSNVGIGTIVGSAVFNILFVIGMCAVFSREMLHLTWWPLFRDVSFYIIDLIMLIIFFLDNTIMWYESIMLVAGYSSYVCFMKYNDQLEAAFKNQLRKHQHIINIITVAVEDEPDKDKTASQNSSPPAAEDKKLLKLKPVLQRGGSSASLHNSTMRNTIYKLMIHTLDPLGNNKEPAVPAPSAAPVPAPGPAPAPTPAKEEETKEEKKEQPEGQMEDKSAAVGSSCSEDDDDDDDDDDDSDEDSSDEESSDEDDDEEDDDDDDLDDNDKPLSLVWPDTRCKQATYLFLLPIVFPLWLTVPDVRNPLYKRFFVITFLGSILWIAVFSYLMVWWAHQVGETIGISEEIMGLTILAAGTSIPDLITSVIVARKGLGDMAVSSSVGSNIFDITMGLPVPWLMWSSLHGFAPVPVSSNGLFCAIVLLFLMLLFVIISIAVCQWKMNKMLGSTMFLLYFVFLVLSVLLEDRVIICPVSI